MRSVRRPHFPLFNASLIRRRFYENNNIALLGFGTVGSGVAETIKRNSQMMAEQLGCQLEITHVLVRHPDKYKNVPLLEGVHLTSSFEEIMADPDIGIVVEVMGGIHPAKEYIF